MKFRRKQMYKLLFILLVTFTPQWAFAKENAPELNIIHGKHHLFSVETPKGWINDKQRARSMNLVSLFYPKDDTTRGNNVFIYAMGYDKQDSNETLDDFITADIVTFKQQNPKLTYKKLMGVGLGAILNSEAYAFENLEHRFKEEVIYMETKHTIIVLVFSALSKKSYKQNVKLFDSFITSFNFRGHDPQPFLKSYDPYKDIRIGMSGWELVNLLGESIDVAKDISQVLRNNIDDVIEKNPDKNATKYYVWKRDDKTYYTIGFDAKENVTVKHKIYYFNLTKKK